MGLARKYQIDLEVTPFYHCVSRCVRRAFLCGNDRYSGQSFDHRRALVVQRMQVLAGVFAIDICAYAVMSNHLHLVLRVDQKRVARWTDDQVVARVGRVFGSVFVGFDDMSAATQRQILAKWRERLVSISWFMRCLNEWLARRANREDQCKGHFWEGRFKSQALLDDGAVLACMSYVDLNPIRAAMAKSLKGSDFTAVQQRLRAVAQAKKSDRPQPAAALGLAPLIGESRRFPGQKSLPISLADYIELLEWTGRAARHGIRGSKTGPPPKLLDQNRLNSASWLNGVQHWGSQTWHVVGAKSSLHNVASVRGLRWCKGLPWAARMYRAG